jgi:ParB family protein of integrating conjugative element (PFGI_1 class)
MTMASKSLSPEDLKGKLLQGSFSRSGPIADQLADPIAETPMVLTIEQMIPYERNPRTITNSKYQEIKDSIRARGLDQPPSVTRRPGHPKFIIRNGGNTRLSILRELYNETGEERFFKINVLFRPWDEKRGEIISLTGHLAENDLQGQLMFIERAVGVENARQIYEEEAGEPISQRELARRLAADGYPVSQSHISRMQDTVRYLLPAIQSTLYTGLGKHQVERLLALRKNAAVAWESIAPLNPASPDFDTLFLEVLSQFDVEATEFVYERFQDELIGNMHAGTTLTYEHVLLSITEQQTKARRSDPLESSTYVPRLTANPELDAQQAGHSAANPQQSKPENTAPSKKPREPSPPRQQQIDPSPQTVPDPELTDEGQASRIAGHIVSPVGTTDKVLEIKRQVAGLDGEELPDFKANALVSIPVQAGGLYPISDVWYVERELDWPEQLRRVAAQLAREVAEISGLGGSYVSEVPAGLGFICAEPAPELELSTLAANTLTLLQSLSGVYAIALSGNPDLPADFSEFKFTAALGQLFLGQPAYLGLQGEGHSASLSDRLDDVAVVKLFRLIRLGRRLVELEAHHDQTS